jgi:hypothetical protein
LIPAIRLASFVRFVLAGLAVILVGAFIRARTALLLLLILRVLIVFIRLHGQLLAGNSGGGC